MKVRECRIECDGRDIFVIADGVKIAKRGHPGTPQAGTWVSLEPGWRVLDCQETSAIEIEFNAAKAH